MEPGDENFSSHATIIPIYASITRFSKIEKMKIKYSIILCGLAVAFAAVSLWVILSGGRNSKALKTKFRLGGLILTVSSMIACSEGAGPMQVSCYDVQAPEYVIVDIPGESKTVKVGGEIDVTIQNSGCESFSFKMLVNAGKDVLQEGFLGKTEGTYKVKVAETEYRGEVLIEVYGSKDGNEVVLGGRDFVLE